MINGQVFRIRQLCSLQSDQREKLNSYFKCLLARGYDKELLLRLFRDAQLKRRQKKEIPDGQRIFFHLRYHPKNPTPSYIQKLWKLLITNPPGHIPLNRLKNCFGVKTGIDTLVISQSRSPNLGNLLSYRKLKDDAGPPASAYMA